MPISIRTESDGPGGNRITLARFRVPAGLPDPARADARDASGSPTRGAPNRHSAMTQGIATGLNLLPASFLGGMLKHVDFLASNVPGFPMPVYLAGGAAGRVLPVRSDHRIAAVNVTLMSYMDTCCVGINADTGAIPDIGEFMVCLRDGFREVLAVGRSDESASPAAAARRATPPRPTPTKAARGQATSAPPRPVQREGGEAPWR